MDPLDPPLVSSSEDDCMKMCVELFTKQLAVVLDVLNFIAIEGIGFVMICVQALVVFTQHGLTFELLWISLKKDLQNNLTNPCLLLTLPTGFACQQVSFGYVAKDRAFIDVLEHYDDIIWYRIW